jgi:UDP-N-acetylmuramate--alanine ligase
MRWHFIGIGGSGMSALAHALLDRGDVVSGSDQSESAVMTGLAERGASVHVGHDGNDPMIAAADRIVVTEAVPKTNAELVAARDLVKPVVRRAALLGELIVERTGIAVAGTAGKTTTTAMVAWILRESGRDPSFVVGGTMLGVGRGGYWGNGPELVAEADEYAGSFWELHPQIAVVMNVEAEHLDFYGDFAGVQASFRRFAGNVPAGGTLLFGGDDRGARDLYDVVKEPSRTYSLFGTTADCDWVAANESRNAQGGSDFELFHRGHRRASVRLIVPGHHNVLDALAALAAVDALGAVDIAAAAETLGSFRGTKRRLEVVGTTTQGVLVIDDYSHHPTKIAAALDALRAHLPERRQVVIFQPHTYSRTRNHLDEFARTLAPADVVIVMDIYGARERDTMGVTSQDLVDRINAISAGKALLAPAASDALDAALQALKPGDIALTMGAGDVWMVAERLMAS